MEKRVAEVVEAKLEVVSEGSDAGLIRVPKIYVDPGDTIRWAAGDHIVSIWFPIPGVFPAPALANKKSGDIDVAVPKTAKPGVYEYSIFCHDKGQFAICNSHPIVEIPKP